MGFYINPPDCRPHGKSSWLNENGVALPTTPAWDEIPADCCVVCCVDNGPFEAAGICKNPKDLELFSMSKDIDPRPKQWFYIEKKLAIEHATPKMTEEDFGV